MRAPPTAVGGEMESAAGAKIAEQGCMGFQWLRLLGDSEKRQAKLGAGVSQNKSARGHICNTIFAKPLPLKLNPYKFVPYFCEQQNSVYRRLKRHKRLF
jgi:hypothetical protein